MRLTILGSGTLVPNGGRNSAGYFLEAGGIRLMMDCGAGTLHALARYALPWEHMTHLFVSHFHVDHVAEMPSVLHALKWGATPKRVAPLAIIGPQGLDRVVNGFKQALGDSVFETGFPVALRIVDPGCTLDLAKHCILSVVKTPHTEESIAVRVQSGSSSVCYTGDTAFSEEAADFFGGCSLMISECSYKERKPGLAHLCIDDVARMATRARAERLVVTHRYFDANEADLKQALARNYSGQIFVGSDGMAFEL